jgi:hypothetical protein
MRGHIVKLVPLAASAKLGRQLLLFKKNSPALMFGAGVAGAVTATVLACKATLKVEEVLADAEKEQAKMDEAMTSFPDRYTENHRARDLKLLRIQTAVKLGRLYAPSIGVGLLSVGLLTGSHVTLTRRNAALTAAYAVLDRGFNEYRDRVRAELGEDKDKEFRYGVDYKEIVEEGEHGHEVKTIKKIGPQLGGRSIYARPFDKNNRKWSNHHMDNRMFIQTQQQWANDRLRAHGWLTLNDVYDSLGLERTKEGTVVGWVKNGKNGDGYVTFGLEDNTEPVYAFMEGDEKSIWLDFNVDGVIYDQIDRV